MSRMHLGPRLFACAAALTMAVLAPVSRASDYPIKPVTVVVPYPAGGPTDVLMRALAPRLATVWKQQVIVDNRPGANEIIGTQLVSRAAADGYTLLFSSEVPLTMNQYLFRKLNYDPAKDFAPVMRMVSSPLVLVVHPDVPVNSVEEFIALAKSRGSAKPVTYASAGTGGVLHLPMVMLARQNGLEMTHVPYKGVAPLLADLVGGQVESAWVAVAGAAPYVRDGKLKALVMDAPSRVSALPQVPVFAETRVSHVQADFNLILQAPAGTPQSVTEKVASDVRAVLGEAEIRTRFLDPFGFVIVASKPAELADFLAKDRARQGERIKVSGVVME
jgi:tripartite-type tricarboxylate transporter receptor subunit TctC